MRYATPVSWCLFGEALNKSRHPKRRHGAGVLIGNRSERVSLHHSLLANLDFRNPLVKHAAAVDIVENLVYNWGRTGGEVVDEIGCVAHLNVTGNLYLAGPASRIPALVVNQGETAPSIYPKIFALDNRRPQAVAERDQQFRVFSLGCDRQTVPRAVRVSQAFASPAVPRVGSATLQATILAQVGGYPRIAAASAALDSDYDDMPDACEVGAGLDTRNAADAGADRGGDGCTNIEEYLKSLLGP